MNKENIFLLKKIINQTLNLAFKYSVYDPEGVDMNNERWIKWDWNMGVAFYGIIEANKYLDNSEYIKIIRKWIDSRIKDKSPKICINTCALLPVVLKLYGIYKDNKYDNLCKNFDDYLMKMAPRVFNGAYAHTTLNKIHLGKVWATSLFMTGIYLAERGLFNNKHFFYNESINQLYHHIVSLFDKKTNLFYHCWNDIKKIHEGTKWARGNAWILISAIDILEIINFDFPEKNEILLILKSFINILPKLQHESGLWHTVLDRRDTYPETSASAGLAYGILKGIRLGIFDSGYKDMALKAVSAVIGQIDNDGNVKNGSQGTSVKETEEEYNAIPFEITPFTQGLAMLALTEYIFEKSY